MNTKSLLTRIGVPVLSLGLLGGLGATLATSASAAVKPVTVTANTHLNNHPDTTRRPWRRCPDLVFQRAGLGLRQRHREVHRDPAVQRLLGGQRGLRGQLPRVRGPWGERHHRPVSGLRPGARQQRLGQGGHLLHRSPRAIRRTRRNLPGQSASDAHLTDNIKTLFGGNVPDSAIGGGNAYVFNYQNGNYVQNQPANGPYAPTGDVQGHCPRPPGPASRHGITVRGITFRGPVCGRHRPRDQRDRLGIQPEHGLCPTPTICGTSRDSWMSRRLAGTTSALRRRWSSWRTCGACRPGGRRSGWG